MSNKITATTLAALLSRRSGESLKTCESFVREFFALVESRLSEGDNVKAKGFGTFKVISVSNRKSVDVNTGEEIEIPGHKKIVFVPAKELAEEVNAPFAAFESVEVSPEAEAELEEDDVLLAGFSPDDAPLQQVAAGESASADLKPETAIPAGASENNDSPADDLNNADKTDGTDNTDERNAAGDTDNTARATSEPIYFLPDEETETPPAAETTDTAAESPTHTPDEKNAEQDDSVFSEAADTASVETEMTNDEEVRRRYGRGKFAWGFLLGVSVASVFGFLLYFFFLQKMLSGPEHPSAEMIVKSDTVPAAVKEKGITAVPHENTDSLAETVETQKDFPDTRPSDETIYGTVTTRCYLTTLAKQHYGNYNLWPYIYEENKAILGHPDRITPGTRVVIPPLSKYGVNPDNPADVAKAKKMGEAIYARYR